MVKELKTDVAIIGAGTAGMYAAREVRRAGRGFVLIDQGPLGTVCARVGCMPSKSALQAGADWQARLALAEVSAGGPGALAGVEVDRRAAWARVRSQRDAFAGRAADNARRMGGDGLILGRARFLEPTLLEVVSEAGVQHVRAEAVVIATGSRPVMPGFLEPVRERTVSTDEFFELTTLPARVGVLGLGAIGVEMGLAMARLGVEVIGADMSTYPANIVDPEVGPAALARFGREMTLWMGEAARVEPTESGVRLVAGDQQVDVDLLLASLGRRANVDGLGLEEAGFALDARGIPAFDPATMQVGDSPVYIVGDANASVPLFHEAADQGAIAGYNAARAEATRFQRKVGLSIAFSAPDVVHVGARFDMLDLDEVVVGSARGRSNGRAVILGATDNLLRVYASKADGRLLGACMLGQRGEHLAHLLAWAVQRGESAESLLALPYYHPTIEEMLQSALQDIVRQRDSGSDLPFGLTAL